MKNVGSFTFGEHQFLANYLSIFVMPIVKKLNEVKKKRIEQKFNLTPLLKF